VDLSQFISVTELELQFSVNYIFAVGVLEKDSMASQSELIQKKLFQYIKDRLPAHLSLVDELCELLNISYDSAYRRIRGEKPLSLDELQKLSTHYRISIDALFNVQSDAVVFHSGASSREAGMAGYFDSMSSDLEKVKIAANKKIIVSAKDIPFVYYFNFPELAWFKVFFWGKTMLKQSGTAKQLFSFENMDRHVLEKGRKTLMLYNNVPSVEIWSLESANGTIRQIQFYAETGSFKNTDDIKILYDQLDELLEHLKNQAEAGQKYLHGSQPKNDVENFELFVNDIILGNTTILLEADQHQQAFFFHDVLDFLSTTDKRFYERTASMLTNIIKKSTLISSVNEKERMRFFMHLMKKVRSTKAEVGSE
jgi:hypothetical protein